MSLVYSNNSVALGTGDYNNMKHKPAIGGVELTENTTLEQLGLGAAFRYKGQVETVNDLPTENVSSGDTYNVIATGDNYTWSGTSWDKLSGKVITTVIKEW